MRSAPMFFECLPEGIDKAAGYKQLIKAIGAEDRFTVAAGDFMNDLAMIQSADLGAAVASAQPSARSVEQASTQPVSAFATAFNERSPMRAPFPFPAACHHFPPFHL